MQEIVATRTPTLDKRLWRMQYSRRSFLELTGTTSVPKGEDGQCNLPADQEVVFDSAVPHGCYREEEM